ncbi:hypothetical protein ACX0G7_16450 [Flavitalea antarctica]
MILSKINFRIRYWSMLMLVVSCVVSCKKDDLQLNAPSAKSDHEKAILAAGQFFDTYGKRISLISNAKGTSGICDADGNLLLPSISNVTTMSSDIITNGITSCTDANGDPIYTFDDVTFSGSSSFLCGINNGYKLQVTFMITTELPLVSTSTRGQLRLRNSANSVIYSNTNITPVSVVATSQINASFPNSTVYSVTYESGYISQSTYQSAVSVENNCILRTTCSDPLNVATQYLASYTLYIGGISSAPCSRIDEIYFNPPMSPMPASLSGCNGGGQCTGISGYSLPNQHEVEFQAVGGTAVSEIVVIDNFEVKNVYAGTEPDNAFSIYVKAGSYKMRYRNKMVSGTTCVGPWSAFGPTITF